MLHAISAYAARKISKTAGPKTQEWHDAYGIWFVGALRKAVEEKHGRLSWVFLDSNPHKLEEKEYEIDVWGKQGTLIFWKAQGYPRGIVAFAEDTDIIKAARKVAKEKPWSFEQISRL